MEDFLYIYVNNNHMSREYENLIESLRSPHTLELLSILASHEIDYSFKSLMVCEETINAMYPEGHKPLPTTLIPFGFLLGETIVRNLGGEWNYDAEDIWDISINIKSNNDNEMSIKPFLRVSKFWNDRTDAMTAMYRMIEYSTDADLSPENLGRFEDEEGWVHFPDGFKFRVRRES